MSPSRLGSIARMLVRRRRASSDCRSTPVIRGTIGPAGRVFRRETPDGRAVVVAFHLGRRVWQAKQTGAMVVYEAYRLADAVADACGDDPETYWIRTLEAKILAATGTSAGQP